MSLHTSTIHRNLDAKMKILGFDAPELLSVLIFAAIMNLFFGKTALGPVLVMALPLLTLIILYFGKKGKPEGFIAHYVQYLVAPGNFSAGEFSPNEDKQRRKIYECTV